MGLADCEVLPMNERALERLRELRSSFNSIGLALRPLENRFADEIGVLFWLRMAEHECEMRIEEAKEALTHDSTPLEA